MHDHDTLNRLREQVRFALPQALHDDDQGRREQFIAQLEGVATQVAAGQHESSPPVLLAHYLRACIALLRGTPFDRSVLLAEDRALLEALERGEQPIDDPLDALAALPESVVAALLTNDQQALERALQALPAAERAAVVEELQRQMAAQMETLSPEQQQALQQQAQQQQIAEIHAQVQQLAQAALRYGNATARAELAAQVTVVAERASEGEAAGSPYSELARYLHAVVALLRGEPVPSVPDAYAAQLAELQ